MRWVVVVAMVFTFALAARAPALAAPPEYYPPIEFVPAARSNYAVGRTMAITQIIIHETGGAGISAINRFPNPRSRGSAPHLGKTGGRGGVRFVARRDPALPAPAAHPPITAPEP